VVINRVGNTAALHRPDHAPARYPWARPGQTRRGVPTDDPRSEGPLQQRRPAPRPTGGPWVPPASVAAAMRARRGQPSPAPPPASPLPRRANAPRPPRPPAPRPIGGPWVPPRRDP
jgi:hypothetical protein